MLDVEQSRMLIANVCVAWSCACCPVVLLWWEVVMLLLSWMMLPCWHWIPALLSVETLVAVVVWGRAVETAAGTLVVKVVYALSVHSLFFGGG